MKDILIVITGYYPYGKGEEFFETEIKYLSKSFDRIYIIPSTRDFQMMMRSHPGNVEIKRPESKRIDLIFSPKYIFNEVFQKELSIIKNEYKMKLNGGMFISMLATMYAADRIYKIIAGLLESVKSESNIYLYSYWMNHGALAISGYKSKNKHVKAFCRAHGADLYAERNINNYLPFRNYMLENLDNVYLISHHGKKYLSNKFKNIDKDKLVVSRLGVCNPCRQEISSRDNILQLASCSFVIKLKRINLIIEALSEINDIEIKWTHIGDGELRPEVERLARERLAGKSNIAYEFKGYMPNEKVFEYYDHNKIDVFINVSQSEGLPVSMMEAFSFAIPIIATDVGGVSEIVNENNGMLLSADPSVDEIRAAITRFKLISAEERQSYRANAYKTWEKSYHAERNYREFIKMIKHEGVDEGNHFCKNMTI
ncbi:MAG: glycosyltransferase [Dethiobacteria bacterium]